MRIAAIHATHDSSVAIFNDGKLEFFCKEERLSGNKRDGMPFFSIDKASELYKSKIDVALFCSATSERRLFKEYIKKKLDCRVEQYSDMTHHASHAAISYFNSGFDESLVFVIDRNGSGFFDEQNTEIAREAESVFVFNKSSHWAPVFKRFNLNTGTQYSNVVSQKIRSKFNCTTEARSPFGIVSTYECATTLINQNPLENGKTMGLAAYSDKTDFEPLFDDNDIPISSKMVADIGDSDPQGRWWLGNCFFDDVDRVTSELVPQNCQFYANKAKQVQLQTQDVVLRLIRKWVDETGIKKVCLSGGYAMNVVANNHLIKSMPDVEFYFEPVADDTGLTIGAAMLYGFERFGIVPDRLTDTFYHYWEEEPMCGAETTAEQVAKLLALGKSVAIFEGKPEAGARALGHRSILLDPSIPDAQDQMNKIKKREWYRPFAGVILEEYFDQYFDSLGLKSAPDMTISFDVKREALSKLGGIVHADGSCRVQTVSSGKLADIIREFNKLTGIPALMNTSFNLAGDPLVQTVDDALSTLMRSELDYVVFVDGDTLRLV